MGRLASSFQAAVAAHRDALAHLAASRAPDTSTTGLAPRHGDLDAAIGRLDQRLGAQHERLARLGYAIGQHVSSRPVEPSGVVNSAEAVVLAGRSADGADVAATEAEELARRAPLLPGLPPVARNLVVYLACALVAVALQYALLVLSDAGRIDGLSLLGLMCAGLPWMAFGTGYVVISLWGRPRLRLGAYPHNPRLGLAICFLAMPIVYFGYKLLSALA